MDGEGYGGRLLKSVTKIVTGCLRTKKVAILAVYNLKGLLVKYEKKGTMSIYTYHNII